MVFLDAWVEKANVHETTVLSSFISTLADSISRLVADASYNGQSQIELVETNDGSSIIRRLVTLIAKTNSNSPKRVAYVQYYASPLGRHFYELRQVTIEPLLGRIKTIFHMKDRVWIKGLDNVRMLFLTAVYTYQIVMRICDPFFEPICRLISAKTQA